MGFKILLYVTVVLSYDYLLHMYNKFVRQNLYSLTAILTLFTSLNIRTYTETPYNMPGRLFRWIYSHMEQSLVAYIYGWIGYLLV